MVNAEYYGEPPESLPPRLVEAHCDRSDLVASVVRRAPFDTAASRLWTDYINSKSMSLWILPAAYAVRADRLRSDTVGLCILHPDATVGQLIDYFGAHVTREPRIALYPAAPIGGSSFDFLIELGGEAQQYLSQRSAWGIVNDLLAIYGGSGLLHDAHRRVANLRLRALQRDGRAWLHRGQVTRRLARLVDSRPTWECNHLARLLGLDHAATGRLLDRRGFALSSEDLRTWRSPTQAEGQDPDSSW